MRYPVLKAIGAGVSIGLALFLFPLTIRIVGAIVFIGFLVRLIRGPRWHRYGYMHMAWSDSASREAFEKMTPEEKDAFRRKMRMHHCGGYYEMRSETKETPKSE